MMRTNRLSVLLVALVALPAVPAAQSAELVTPEPAAQDDVPLFQIFAPEGRETISLPAATDGSERMWILVDPSELAPAGAALGEDLVPPAPKEGASATFGPVRVLSGMPIIPPVARSHADNAIGGAAASGEGRTFVPFQAAWTGPDYSVVQGELSGCDAFHWLWGYCTDPWDNTQATGVYATIEYQTPVLNGDDAIAVWPGTVLSNGHFIQVGYALDKFGGGQYVFVQIFQSGHLTDPCNNGYVTCLGWNSNLVPGTRYVFEIRSGVDGVANRWGFYAANTELHKVDLGTSHTGSETPYVAIERQGPNHAARQPNIYWDCGLCIIQSGTGWHSPRHAEYDRAGQADCTLMASWHLHWPAEFDMGDNDHGTCPSVPTRVW